ncbi:hypothetical protein NON20_16330 [Synechocystis sp. B12]|nr:hypothetical protein NON20_16330 [Synechocystis sp. B12]
MAKNSLRVAGLGTPDNPITPELVPAFQQADLFITGAFALEQGLIFSAMILAAMTVYIIEQKFGLAALWAIAAGILSWLGLMHSYRWTGADTVMALGWGAGASWAISYFLLALLLIYVQWTNPKGQD